MRKKPNAAYWKTREGAAFNAACELCNPDASLEERNEAAALLRKAFGMPTAHKKRCATHEIDEATTEDCSCGYWDEPKAA